MKKTSISILYDSEKLNAMKIYLEQKNIDIKIELEKALDNTYLRYVPNNVREFIDMKADMRIKKQKESNLDKNKDELVKTENP